MCLEEDTAHAVRPKPLTPTKSLSPPADELATGVFNFATITSGLCFFHRLFVIESLLTTKAVDFHIEMDQDFQSRPHPCLIFSNRSTSAPQIAAHKAIVTMSVSRWSLVRSIRGSERS